MHIKKLVPKIKNTFILDHFLMFMFLKMLNFKLTKYQGDKFKMSNFSTYFSYLPKKALTIALALTSALALSGAVLAGFGPDRPTIAYTPGVSGFDYVTFNSFTGVPNGIGDEREFVRGKIVGVGSTTIDPIENVKDGDELYITVYVHNNAKGSLGVLGEAQNLRAKVDMPAGSSTSHEIKGTIAASNANPVSVYDTITINGSEAFELEYVPGSATMITNALNYVSVNDGLVTNGADIGYDALDGTMPGCFEFSGWVNFRVKVKVTPTPKLEIVKDVQEGPNQPWVQSINAVGGDTFRYRVNVSNTGNVDLTNVVVKDVLPAHLNNVSVTKGGGPNYVGNLFAEGITIANFPKGETLTLIIEATLDEETALPCGRTSLLNVASADSESTDKVKDNARVITDRTCTEQTPVYQCNGVQITKLGGLKIKVSTTVTASPANLVTVKGYTYDFNSDGKVDLTTTKAVVEHTYDKYGKKTVDVQVTFEVDEDGNVTTVTKDCGSTVTLTETPKELPNTGPASFIATLFGTSTLGTAIIGWIRSKKDLLSIG